MILVKNRIVVVLFHSDVLCFTTHEFKLNVTITTISCSFTLLCEQLFCFSTLLSCDTCILCILYCCIEYYYILRVYTSSLQKVVHQHTISYAVSLFNLTFYERPRHQLLLGLMHVYNNMPWKQRAWTFKGCFNISLQTWLL